jgi:predicted amidohydrolase YtcJ
VFRETAQSLVGPRRHDAAQKDRDVRKAIELAMQECLAKGITSFQDAGSSFATIDIFKQLAEAGRLEIRLWVMVGDTNARMARLLPKYRMIGVADDHLTVRAIKRFIDGALGAHGAWLLAPYDDLPSSTGLNTSSVESIRRTAELAQKYDFQLCVHAIGDRANREILNLFEDAFRRQPSTTSRRWRVEHAQHLHSDDIPRFAQLGVIASMQGVHCTSDAPFVIKRLGHQRAAEGAYVWQSLIQSGAIVVNGSDAPVEDVDPIACFYASVTRELPSGAIFFPEQRMTREQALRSYTLNAAYAAFEEHIKGSLSPRKLADIAVLSEDIMTCPDEEILKAKVVYTIVGGEVLYKRHEAK